MAHNVLLVNNDKIGSEYEDLGKILMKSYLSTLLNENTYDYIILVNSGVKLACLDEGQIADLKQVENRTAILACGTCLSYFELENDLKVGQVSNMKVISGLLAKAVKVVSI